METLSLGYNKITNIPAQIGLLKRLKVLKIYVNHIQYIHPDIGNLRSLEKLYFGWNRLFHLPTEIGQLQNLKWLKVSHNQLTALPSLKNLNFLDVSHNQIHKIPDTILSLKLDQLILSQNPIDQEYLNYIRNSMPSTKIIIKNSP